ncbi:MAG: hypothetical protein IPN65_09315 [Elusimicrobia bacterium]|nr:hypothetical protein [Elusimicrobiota bacterium]
MLEPMDHLESVLADDSASKNVVVLDEKTWAELTSKEWAKNSQPWVLEQPQNPNEIFATTVAIALGLGLWALLRQRVPTDKAPRWKNFFTSNFSTQEERRLPLLPLSSCLKKLVENNSTYRVHGLSSGDVISGKGAYMNRIALAVIGSR